MPDIHLRKLPEYDTCSAQRFIFAEVVDCGTVEGQGNLVRLNHLKSLIKLSPYD